MTKKHWIIFSVSAGLNALGMVAAYHFTDGMAVRRTVAGWIYPIHEAPCKGCCCGDVPSDNCTCNPGPKALPDNLKNGVRRPTGQIGEQK